MSIKYNVPVGPPSPLLNPPPKRGREEEEEEEQNTTAGRSVNKNKCAKIPWIFTSNRKRRGNPSDPGGKRPKLNKNRAMAEQRVEAINKEYNMAVSEKKAAQGISSENKLNKCKFTKKPRKIKKNGNTYKMLGL